MNREILCPEEPLVRQFLLGEVTYEEVPWLTEHLEACAHCRALVTEPKDETANGFSDSGEAPSQRTEELGDDASGLDLTDLNDASAQSGEVFPSVDLSETNQRPLTEVSEVTGEYSREAAAPAAASPPSSPPADEGVVVPGYQILEELGRGGMGVVYKARHLRLQRLVALKMILAGAHASENALIRFRTEAEAIAQLQHPNIVQIYEIGELDGVPYFSLEFVDGGSLDHHIRETPLSHRAAAELVETLGRTMDVAHQLGIVHRDLKPANILLAHLDDRGSKSEDRRSKSEQRRSHGDTASTSRSSIHDPRASNLVPKITDFGLAKKVNDDDSTQTQVGTVLGTPSYMAPEQAEGKSSEIGPAADIYALGAILYDLIAGRPPFKAGKAIDTIRQVIDQEPVPPRQLEPRVPRDLETICLKCLRKEPDRRYATALELADDLRRFLRDEPILARPTSAWERAWKWGKRRPAVVGLLGVSVAAVVAVVLLIVWHNISLRDDVAQARAEERLEREQAQAEREKAQAARDRELAAIERERVLRMEVDGQKLLDDARLAAAARDWATARLHLTRVLATVGAEPRLEPLKAPAQALLNKVEQELRADSDRQASQARLTKFASVRDEAQFLGTVYTGMELPANLNATRATVLQALAIYGISVDSAKRVGPAFDAYLSDAQKAEVQADCYQLLLILAETEAQAAADLKPPEQEQQLGEALRILEEALRFGAPSRAYHLRRARYLGRLGDAPAMAQAEKAAAETASVHVLDFFLVADESFRRGKFDEAIKEFDQVLQRKPGHFWGQYLNSLCLLRQHRTAEAKAQLSACLAQRPDFVWLYLLRGFAQAELQVYDGADADFQKAAPLCSDDNSRYVLLVNRGVLRVRQNRLDNAVTDLKTAIELKPNDHQAYVNLAQAYRLQKKLDLALEQINRAVQIDPTSAQLYRLRARLHLERKEPAPALSDFERAIQYEHTNSPYLADDHVERGRLLLQDKKYSDALASFDAALRLRKDHLSGQRLRAEALFQLGRFQEVVEAFDRYLIEKGKPLESVYRGRGLARTELGKYPGAIEDFTKALEIHPTSAVQAYRGWAHLVCDAPKLALRDFQLAIDQDATNADAYNGRGLILASESRLPEAVSDADRAIRLGPKTPRLLYNAARIHAQCGGSSELRAIELIRQALDLLPTDKRASFWSTYIQKDGALQAIRKQPQFLQLDAEMSQRP